MKTNILNENQQEFTTVIVKIVVFPYIIGAYTFTFFLRESEDILKHSPYKEVQNKLKITDQSS